jgi:hypothetical protein
MSVSTRLASGRSFRGFRAVNGARPDLGIVQAAVQEAAEARFGEWSLTRSPSGYWADVAGGRFEVGPVPSAVEALLQSHLAAVEAAKETT